MTANGMKIKNSVGKDHKLYDKTNICSFSKIENLKQRTEVRL